MSLNRAVIHIYSSITLPFTSKPLFHTCSSKRPTTSSLPSSFLAPIAERMASTRGRLHKLPPTRFYIYWSLHPGALFSLAVTAELSMLLGRPLVQQVPSLSTPLEPLSQFISTPSPSSAHLPVNSAPFRWPFYSCADIRHTPVSATFFVSYLQKSSSKRQPFA